MHSLMNTCSQSISQSVIYQVLNAVSDGVFKKRRLMEKIFQGQVLKSTCGIVVFIDMNTYILTKGRNFKTFLKENYAIALDSCYLFFKKMLNMELMVLF